MSREEFIEKLPLEDRPESDEKKLLFIFNHPMPKVRDEFFALLRVYHAIISTCDTPNGFGFIDFYLRIVFAQDFHNRVGEDV